MIRRLRWSDYRTGAGARPVKAFIDGLTDEQAAAVVAAMKDVARNGLASARHLRGEVYEVRAEADRKRAKTPPDEIVLAESHLADWRRRGRTHRP